MERSARDRVWPLFIAVRRNTCPMRLSRIEGTDRFRLFHGRMAVGVLNEDTIPAYLRNRTQGAEERARHVVAAS